MKKSLAALSLLLVLPGAWSQERFEVIESVMLDASAEQAWDLVNDFDALDSWHPAVTKTEIVEGEVPHRGALRVLTIGDGEGMVRETLTHYSDADMTLSYVINSTDIIPVSDYGSTVNVVAVSDELSLVIWSGEFLANPPEGQPDSASREAIVGIYRAGLDNLQNLLAE
jgi:mxaD protein